MKGIFDELIDIYKEVEEEIKKEVNKSQKTNLPRRVQKTNSDNTNSTRPNNRVQPARRQESPKNNKTIRQQVEEVDENKWSDMKDAKNLRDVTSNLEGRKTYIESIGRKKTKLGDYSERQDQIDRKEDMEKSLRLQKEEEERLAKLNANLNSSSDQVIKKELKELVQSLKSEDKIKSARKAFLYSEIFNRKAR